MLERHDYRYCPNGGRHHWVGDGGSCITQANTLINQQRCVKCDRKRMVYSNSGRRYSR